MNTNTRKTKLIATWQLGLGLTALLPHSTVFAQGTWDGGGTTSDFTDAANWVGDVAPTTNGLYTFAGGVNLSANNNLTLTGADNTLTFDATAGLFTLTGGAIRMGGVNNNSSSLQTINLNLRLNGGRTINTGSAGVNLGAFITSTGTSSRTVTKTGASSLTITNSGTNNRIAYTVNAGDLVMGNATGTLTLPAVNDSNASALIHTFASGTNLVFSQAGTAVVAGQITGAGSVRVNSTGSSTLSNAANNYTGGTVVEDGILTVANSFTMSGANGFSLDGSATPVAGTDNGTISATVGTFSYGGDLALAFSGIAVSGATYDLFDFAGATLGLTSFDNVSIGGSYTASLTNSSGIWSGMDGGFTFTFTEATGDLVVSAIPEPSTWAAIFGAVGLGFAACRRRRTA